jgi:hypothetical protein
MKRLYIGCVLLLYCASCRYQSVSKQCPAVNELENHAKFMVNLPEEHDSGYLWQLRDDYDRKVVSMLNSVWHGAEKGVDFNFFAEGAGTATLRFFKRKYNDTSEVRCYSVRITPN